MHAVNMQRQKDICVSSLYIGYMKAMVLIYLLDGKL